MLEIDIYGVGLCFPEFEKQFEAIEAALGFKLFAWQKTYIANGNFRRYGATTAQILRELMQVDAFPLDYSIKPTTQREAWYRGFLREIPTLEVFFTKQQKRAYMENPENQRKERERYQEARHTGTPARLWR